MPIAFVTGSTGGIGSSVCQRLSKEGYTVIAHGRDTERLQILREGDPKHILPLQFDICDSQAKWLAMLVECFDYYRIDAPRIDVLVCCHGARPVTTPSLQLSVSHEFIPVFATDVFGTFLAAQAVAPYMIRQGAGSMIFLSSLHARQTYPSRAPYAASKAAVCAMARTLALEWAPYGIRVNSLLPWQVDGVRTQMMSHKAEQETGKDLVSAYTTRSPMRRLITEEEVADAVMFLVKNTGMNGAEVVLDGGVNASMWYRSYTEGS